ncbi:unnamed protein product [Prorocentrum cordatum]|uniref:Uncharacterized protein n=1 Tax=Prorocentrum cordatum TaxID=2364126 RepID=A0ABN9YJL8_9DINO|nr:unnamed protein product [Polarella glacialis]
MQSAHNGAATTRIAAKVEERRLLRRRRARGKLSRARPPRLNSGARATDTDMLFSPKNWVRPARREARVPNGAGATTGVTGSGCRRHEAGEGEVQGGGRGAAGCPGPVGERDGRDQRPWRATRARSAGAQQRRRPERRRAHTAARRRRSFWSNRDAREAEEAGEAQGSGPCQVRRA